MTHTCRPMAPVSAREYREELAATMTEAAFQAQVVALARSLGWLAWHTYDSRRSAPGFPDLTLVHPQRGLLKFRELKTAKGRVRPEQSQCLAALAATGADAAVWRPADLILTDVIRQELTR